MRAFERLSEYSHVIQPHLGREQTNFERIGGLTDKPWNEYAGGTVPGSTKSWPEGNIMEPNPVIPLASRRQI